MLFQHPTCYTPIREAYSYVVGQGLDVEKRKPHDHFFRVKKNPNTVLEVTCQMLSDEGCLVGEWEGYEVRERINGEHPGGVGIAQDLPNLVDLLTAMGGLVNS